MFTFKVLALLLLSVPALDEALPARAETLQVRLLLVREGMPVHQVADLLQLERYSTVHAFPTETGKTHLYWVPPGRCLDVTCAITGGELRLEHVELD
ncbi:MAG: hypothetical protein AB7K24_08855 [Gemmataceae bacterium]